MVLDGINIVDNVEENEVVDDIKVEEKALRNVNYGLLLKNVKHFQIHFEVKKVNFVKDDFVRLENVNGKNREVIDVI